MDRAVNSSLNRKALYTVLGLIVVLLVGVSVYAKTTGPEFSSLTPKPDSIIPAGSIEISARVSDPDGIDPESIYFTLDGEPVVGVKVEASETEINYVAKIVYSANNLTEGSHTVNLKIGDISGQFNVVSWVFTVGPATPEEPIPPEIEEPPVIDPPQDPGTGTESEPPILYNPIHKDNPLKVLTLRYPKNTSDYRATKLYIIAEDTQQLALMVNTGKLIFKKLIDQSVDIRVDSFVYGEPGTPIEDEGTEPDYSRGYFEFIMDDKPDGQYTVYAEIYNELGTGGSYEFNIVVRDKNKNTSCTACHLKKPYDHSTRNCNGCHNIMDRSKNDCKSCHSKNPNWVNWPHGPEVFINPEPSVPTVCTECHFASNVVEPKVKYELVKDHYIID